jgi:hypothetical protein
MLTALGASWKEIVFLSSFYFNETQASQSLRLDFLLVRPLV